MINKIFANALKYAFFFAASVAVAQNATKPLLLIKAGHLFQSQKENLSGPPQFQ